MKDLASWPVAGRLFHPRGSGNASLMNVIRRRSMRRTARHTAPHTRRHLGRARPTARPRSPQAGAPPRGATPRSCLRRAAAVHQRRLQISVGERASPNRASGDRVLRAVSALVYRVLGRPGLGRGVHGGARPDGDHTRPVHRLGLPVLRRPGPRPGCRGRRGPVRLAGILVG